MRETWTLFAPPAPDGYALTEGWVRDVDTREGLYVAPAKVGSNGDAGQGHGELWSPKTFGPGGFVHQLWLMSSLSRRQIEEWYDELLRVVTWPYDLVRVVRGLADGTERECLAEVVTAIEPQPIGQLGMRAALEWSVPAGFWRDTADVIAAASANVPDKTLVSFPALSGGTAPMDSLVIGLHGPWNGPLRLTQPLTGQWVEVAGSPGAGVSMTLDCATGEVAGWPAGSVRYSGATFLELPPMPDTVPLQLSVSHGGGTTAATQVSLTGRRHWLA